MIKIIEFDISGYADYDFVAKCNLSINLTTIQISSHSVDKNSPKTFKFTLGGLYGYTRFHLFDLTCNRCPYSLSKR